jgi:hypothetical protein
LQSLVANRNVGRRARDVRPIPRGDWQIPGIAGDAPQLQVSGMKQSSGAEIWACSTAPTAARSAAV